MFLIAGLGNPDKKYEKTRHNIGFDTVDALAEKYNISITEKKHKALCGSGVIEGVKVILAKPQTYMNLSGESIAEIVNFYKLDPESEMLIIFDDISLAPGNIRVRKKAVQVGIMESRALFQVWEPQTLCELKSVWGKSHRDGIWQTMCLAVFPGNDRARVEEAIRDAEDAAVLMIQGEADKAMNDFNAKKQENTK